MKKSIFKENKKYTFSDYFEMNYLTKEIVGEFGYSFAFEVIDLPKCQDYDKQFVKTLKETFYTVFPKITLNSEIAKREFFDSPSIARNSEVHQYDNQC